jgi:hypothetical protein
MFKRIVLILSTLSLAFFILLTSVLRASSVSYSFDSIEDNGKVAGVATENKEMVIDYSLPYEGKILPDNTLWSLKAFRDKLWFAITSNTSKKAKLLLLFSDKRLLSAKKLFEKNKPEIAFTTLSKGEKYLEQANFLTQQNKAKGNDTTAFEIRLVNAALKHRQVIESLVTIAPENIKPNLITLLSYSQNTYNSSRDSLLGKGIKPPTNPFTGE